jgi:prophage regulatory protein
MREASENKSALNCLQRRGRKNGINGEHRLNKEVRTMTTENERRALKSKPPIEPLDAILRRPAVEQVTGLTTSALYRLVTSGDFPKPVRITKGAVGWRLSAVHSWIESRPTAPM